MLYQSFGEEMANFREVLEVLHPDFLNRLLKRWQMTLMECWPETTEQKQLGRC
jgi:hypothetical protein